MRRISVVMMAAACVAGCSSATKEATFDEPAGCYDLALGAWDGTAEEVLPLPASIELRSEFGSDVLENWRLLLRPNPDTEQRSYRWAWWEEVEADSLRLIWSTGFTGIEMRVGRRADGYVGFAENFLDYPGGTARAQATLRRTDCI